MALKKHGGKLSSAYPGSMAQKAEMAALA